MATLQQLVELLTQQQQQFATQQQQFAAQQKQQQEILALLVQRSNEGTEHKGAALQPTMESLAQSIAEFVFDPENDVTFDAWFHRYEDIFKVDAAQLDDAAKVRLLLRKMHTAVHEKYLNYILPSNPRDKSFEDTVQILTKIFGAQVSQFNVRYRCFQISKSEGDDIIAYASRVNRECEKFKLSELNADQFKCLIFVCGLKAPSDAEYRIRLLNKLEGDPTVTVQKLADEYAQLVNLKQDNKMVEHTSSNVQSVKVKKQRSQSNNTSDPDKHQVPQSGKQKLPPSPCWCCGGLHYTKLCPFKEHRCKQCKTTGHKDGYCAMAKRPKKAVKHENEDEAFLSSGVFCKSECSNELRKFAKIFINGQPVLMQADTGSDLSYISKETWIKLGKPNLQQARFTTVDASNNRMQHLGQFDCSICYKQSTALGKCVVRKQGSNNLFGLDWMRQLSLWDLSELTSGEEPTAPTTPVRQLSTQNSSQQQASSPGTCSDDSSKRDKSSSKRQARKQRDRSKRLKSTDGITWIGEGSLDHSGDSRPTKINHIAECLLEEFGLIGPRESPQGDADFTFRKPDDVVDPEQRACQGRSQPQSVDDGILVQCSPRSVQTVGAVPRKSVQSPAAQFSGPKQFRELSHLNFGSVQFGPMAVPIIFNVALVLASFISIRRLNISQKGDVGYGTPTHL